MSDYAAVITVDGQRTHVAHIIGHRRADGPLELIRRILTEATDEPDVIDASVRDALLDRLAIH